MPFPKKPHNRSLRSRDAIVLVSCYELGQQPLGLAQASTALTAAGFDPLLIDIDVEPLDERCVAEASLVAISVPMHTALRIGVGVAKRVRAVNPDCTLVFYGLYAALNSTYLLETVADACFGGEFEQPLVDLALALESGLPPPAPSQNLAETRSTRQRPMRREGLPPITRYTRLVHEGRHHIVGQVTTTRGCKHLCTHCPLPPVYEGRFYAIPVIHVVQDIAHLVDQGVEHVTFADPDFLNGPGHARRVGRALHERFPGLTFDFTAKIEHLQSQRALVMELQELGCLFVTSAVESLSERTLVALDKGHAANDVLATIRFFADIGLTLRPTFVPFTPWDTRDDYCALLDMIETEGLIDHIDPVQYSIRLLVPPGSLLAKSGHMLPHLQDLDPAGLTFAWRHPDPQMDALCSDVTTLVRQSTRDKRDACETFFLIQALAGAGSNIEPHWEAIHQRYPTGRPRGPRLTESWFC